MNVGSSQRSVAEADKPPPAVTYITPSASASEMLSAANAPGSLAHEIEQSSSKTYSGLG